MKNHIVEIFLSIIRTEQELNYIKSQMSEFFRPVKLLKEDTDKLIYKVELDSEDESKELINHLIQISCETEEGLNTINITVDKGITYFDDLEFSYLESIRLQECKDTYVSLTVNYYDYDIFQSEDEEIDYEVLDRDCEEFERGFLDWLYKNGYNHIVSSHDDQGWHIEIGSMTLSDYYEFRELFEKSFGSHLLDEDECIYFELDSNLFPMYTVHSIQIRQLD